MLLSIEREVTGIAYEFQLRMKSVFILYRPLYDGIECSLLERMGSSSYTKIFVLHVLPGQYGNLQRNGLGMYATSATFIYRR